MTKASGVVETVNTTIAPTAAALADLTNRVLFGDLWQRPDLSARDRANRAMDNGLTAGEASEVLSHIAFYAGWPRAMSAAPVLKQVFANRK